MIPLCYSPIYTVSLTVLSTCDRLVATASSIGTPEDIAIKLILLGTDVDGDALSYDILTLPSLGNSHTLYHLDRGCTDAKVGSGFNFEDSKGYLEVDVSGEPDLTSHASISFEFWIQPKILPTDFGNVARFGDPAFSGVAVFYERSLSTLLSPNKIRRIFNAGAAGKVIPPSNLPPIAEAGPDQTEPIHTRATLSGSGMDDGLSTGSTLS